MNTELMNCPNEVEMKKEFRSLAKEKGIRVTYPKSKTLLRLKDEKNNKVTLKLESTNLGEVVFHLDSAKESSKVDTIQLEIESLEYLKNWARINGIPVIRGFGGYEESYKSSGFKRFQECVNMKEWVKINMLMKHEIFHFTYADNHALNILFDLMRSLREELKKRKSIEKVLYGERYDAEDSVEDMALWLQHDLILSKGHRITVVKTNGEVVKLIIEFRHNNLFIKKRHSDEYINIRSKTEIIDVLNTLLH